ncbi:hypothetical protein ACHHYP_03716 [Achlya hypogyna]|uniref:Uncharacterized protein n=1 Tax=Achlya hypogyna TaxID=1202772 RepID=A0A1V9Z331_ACHHY|nr:hypothetical protein ACHHYP_03716 [Achlya hypogyna]
MVSVALPCGDDLPVVAPAPRRPHSAIVKSRARPESACLAKLAVNLASARQANQQAASKAYLRKAAAKKKLEAEAFADQLNVEQTQLKERLITKIEQANARARYLGHNRVYSLLQDFRGEYAIGARQTDDLHVAVLALEVFEREFRRLVSTALVEASSSSAELRRPPADKEAVRLSLVKIMNATTQLAETLDEQLLEMQRKGWNVLAWDHK